MSQASKNSSAVLSKAASGALGGISSALRRGFYRTPAPAPTSIPPPPTTSAAADISIPLNASAMTSSPPVTYEPAYLPPFLERVGANSNNRLSRKKPHIEFERESVGINLLNSIENIPTGALTEPMHNLSPEDNKGIQLYNSLYKHVWRITSKYILDSSHKNEKDFLLRDIGAELDSIISVDTISSYYRHNFTNAIDALIKSPTYEYAKNTKNRIGMTSIILDYILGIVGPMRELFTAYELLTTKNKEMNETRKKQLLMIATVQDIWYTQREIVKENAHGRTNAAERKRRRSRRNRTNRRNIRRRR